MAAPKGNKFALGNTGGRPPFYKTAQEMEKRISEYFDWIVEQEENGEVLTITGLALFLGFESRQSMYDYKKNNKFTYPIKRALTIIESDYEKGLRSKASTGSIFALKNMDWKDKTEQEITIPTGDVIIKSIGKEID
jgi:hypothetical protein